MHLKFLSLLAFLILIACNQRKEACLDAAATNFDAEAEINCCCEYPFLNLRVEHLADTNSYSADSLYTDAGGNRFLIENLRFFISEVGLIQADGSILEVDDELRLRLANGGDSLSVTVNDSYAYVTSNQFLYTIGRISSFGDFTGIQFSVGLDSAANHNVAELLEETNVLHPTFSDGMYIDEVDGYSFYSVDVGVDVNGDTLADIKVRPSIFSDMNKRSIVLQDTFRTQAAFDVERTIQIDYLQFFEGVDLVLDDAALVEQKILDNMTTAFSVK